MMCNKYEKVSMGLIAYLIVIYLLNYTSLITFVDKGTMQYGVLPTMWIVLIVLMWYKLPKIHGLGKMRYKNNVCMWAFNCGVVWILLNLLAGVVEGFGKSPYSHSLQGILTNVFYVGTALVGRECIRTYLVHTFGRRNLKYTIIFVTLLMVVTDFNILRMLQLRSMQELTIFSAEQLLPKICKNILATTLVMFGGVLPSLIYLGMGEAFEWLLPILPNMDWLAKGVVGIAVPMGCLAVVSSNYWKLTKDFKPYKEKEEKIWSWAPTAIVCVLMVWFTVGVFPVYPSAIATGSMEPMIYPGDVVLVRKMTSQEDIEALQVGEVIQFKRGDILINHRIVAIEKDESTGLNLYQTKGDNNSVVDYELVEMEAIKGVITGVIPKVGWPTLIFKNKDADVLKDVEF